MKTAEFTTRDELYTFLDKMPHDEEKTAGRDHEYSVYWRQLI